MELYVGGYKQGKLRYVTKIRGYSEDVIFNDFHLWIRELMKEEVDVRQRVAEYIREHPECVIICDEIGNGIVPLDPFERRYREEVGRILTDLARQASRVERIVCGLGIRLK